MPYRLVCFQMMIPGLKSCPVGRGWDIEYTGWLAGATSSRSSQRIVNHICVAADAVAGGPHNLSEQTRLADVVFGRCPNRDRLCNGYTPSQRIPCVVCVR